VQLLDDEPLRADIFIVAAGISSNTELARAAGLDVNRGVRVDAHMATSAPGVYAAGDVAEWEGRVMGLWPVAVEQAEVAARNALGEPVDYQEPVLSTVLKVVGADLVSVGDHEGTDGMRFVRREPGRVPLPQAGHPRWPAPGAILIGWPAWWRPSARR
jgi:NAD(P)H-nitrite reductase large subunit